MIRFENLHKAFGDKQVLAGLTLEVQDGETMVVIGYSGTGKSAALKHIVGLLDPDAGDVLVDGRAVSTLDRDALNALRREIGYVFQFAALFDSLTVAENVALGLRRRGLCRRIGSAQIDRLAGERSVHERLLAPALAELDAIHDNGYLINRPLRHGSR